MVNKGDVLFVIEPELYLNAVQQAEAELNSATATLEYAKNNYERMLEASQSDAISQIELIQANTKVSTSEAAVTNAKAALQTAEKNLEYCYIKAPVSGYVSVNNIDVGNYVSGSVQPVKLATLYNNNPIYIYFNIEDNQYLNMAVSNRMHNGKSLLGDSVNIRMMNELMPTIRASVDYLSPNVTLTTGTLNLRAVIKDNNWGLRSGMYCTIELPYSEEKNAILINDASTGTDQLGRYIYVVNDDNTVEYRHIEVGQIINDSLIQVTSGLSKGERYVTHPFTCSNNVTSTSCPSGQVSDEQIFGNCCIFQFVIYLICQDGISVNLIIRELAQIFCLGFFFLSVSSHSFCSLHKSPCRNNDNFKFASIL